MASVLTGRTSMRLLRELLGLDRNVVQVLTYRLWTILAGLITVFFVPRYLSLGSQGYYYTFLSLVAIQALFDLGLSQTVVQISSHEFAHLDVRRDRQLSNPHIAKLAYLKSTIARWYVWVGAAFAASVSVAGAAYFTIFGKAGPGDWLFPWLLLVGATAVNLLIAPRLALVEGAGLTGRIATLRLVQSALGHSLLIVLLMAGAELWSVVAVPLTANVCSIIWLYRAENPYRALPAYRDQPHDTGTWRKEIIGLQWRVAAAWLGGYFAAQSLVPVLFAVDGAEAAGRIGLGLQIFSAIQALGMSWVSARIPVFGSLIARERWPELRAEFTRSAASASVMTALLALGVGTVLILIHQSQWPLAQRIPSSLAIAVLVVTTTLGTVIYSLAAFMRAHKEEPLVGSSLAIGSLIFIGAVLGGAVSGEVAVGVVGAITLMVNLPWTYMLFRRYYSRANREIVDAC